MTAYRIGLGIAFAVACLLVLIFEKRARLEAERQQDLDWETALRNLALTCRRCQALAPPIPRTENRYKCPQCGNQFAGAGHGL